MQRFLHSENALDELLHPLQPRDMATDTPAGRADLLNFLLSGQLKFSGARTTVYQVERRKYG